MIRLLLPAILLASPVEAHELFAEADGGSLWDALNALVLAGAAAIYLGGTARLWRRAGVGHGLPRWRAACFAAGLLTLAASLLSPLHDIGDRLFAAHMLQHMLLMAVAAPLLALGAGPAAAVWTLPRGARRRLGAVLRLGRVLTRLEVATLLQAVALWTWHIPAVYATALASPGMHWLQHASLFGGAMLFWQAVLGRRGRGQPGAAIACLFLTALHTGLLGVLLTFARVPLYPGQSAAAHDLGLTALGDQQLAGLVMWVPGGVIYAIAALALAAAWIRGSSAGSDGLVRPA